MGEKAEILAALDGVNLLARRRAYLSGAIHDMWRLPKQEKRIASYTVDFILAIGVAPKIAELQQVFPGVTVPRLEFCRGMALIRLHIRENKYKEVEERITRVKKIKG